MTPNAAKQHRPLLLTLKEVGAALGYSHRHVRRLVERGVIPVVRLGGGRPRVRRERLRQLLAEAEKPDGS